MYAGLGAAVRVFYAWNAHGQGMPAAGVAYYRVTRTVRGRVTAYRARINAQPPSSALDRIELVASSDLPADAVETSLNTAYCVVWESQRLKALIGMAYAAATTTPDTTVAKIRAEPSPGC